MPYIIDFEKLINYDAGQSGISINAELRLGDDFVEVLTKVDTGATYCIFERIHGEALGLDIEAGMPERISTAAGSFWAFGHQITLITEDFEFDSVVFFAQEESFRRNVLGRHGWLDRVKIAINDYDGQLFLSRYESE